MTYCLGIQLDDGLVLAADSRTNAGVDMVSTFRKLFVFEEPGERVIVVLTAGNLATSQSVISQLEEGLDGGGPADTLYGVESMSGAARMVGAALKNVHRRDRENGGPVGEDSGFGASFIVGGQIRGRRMRLYQVYAESNFIEATEDTPYLQIGETKYGKPILARVVNPGLGLLQAAKCALVSMDSTIRCNISVGPPFDILIYGRDSLRVATHQRIDLDDAYYADLSRRWGEGLKSLYEALPDPEWKDEVR